MQQRELPTWSEMGKSALGELDTARSALSAAADCLRSDWRPVGQPLPGEAGTVRREVMARIGRLKDELDEAKDALWGVLR